MSRTPTHSSSGCELFYRAPGGMMVVPVLETDPTFSRRRRGAFETKYFFSRFVRTYDLPRSCRTRLGLGFGTSVSGLQCATHTLPRTYFSRSRALVLLA